MFFEDPRTVYLAMVATGVAVELAFFVGLPVLLMWGANRLFGRKAAIAIGLLAAGFAIYAVIDRHMLCSTPPIILPSPDGTSEAATFKCDGPMGALDYLFIRRTGPFAVALLLAVTVFHYVKFLRSK
jgi:hypothetical protein